MQTEKLSRQEAVRRAAAIDGWTTQAELGALYDLARAADGPIVEIGSYRGRSTAALALGSMAGAGHPVYAVDPFVGPQEGARRTSLGNAAGPGGCSAGELRANLDAAGVNGLVRIVPRASREAAAEVPDCAVLFVDGDHAYEAVSEDLRLYLPKVRERGTVVLHDVTDMDPGVPRAVDEQLMTAPDRWRVRGRVDTAALFVKAPTLKHSVYLAFPGRGFEWGAVKGVLEASRGHEVTVGNNSNGWDDFNLLWANALNAFEAGQVTHFAMLHSDVLPQSCWLDVLLGELDDLGADLVSTVVPLKDTRGLTSTGVGDWDYRWGAWRRFTVREVLEFPETFGIEDTPHPGRFLLHNTGCWACDLRNPLFRSTREDGSLRCWFDFPTRVARDAAGKWVNVRESEDWFFSRCVATLRLKTFATRKVPLCHRGVMDFDNQTAWGSYRDGDLDSKARWGPEAAPAP